MDNIERLFNQLNGPKKEAVPQWEQPIPFDSRTLPVFDSSVFPDWLSKYIEAVAETTQTPVDVSSFVTISVLSTILSKIGYVKVTRDWKESLNTYCIMALPPGNRKSVVFKLLAYPITVHEQEERERLIPLVKKQQAIMKAKDSRLGGLNTQYAKKGEESILKEIQLLTFEIDSEETIKIPRYTTNDVTVEKLGELMSEHNEKMAVLSAEGAGALMSIAGRYDKGSVDASMNLYLEAHPGDSVTIDRMGRESIHLEEPSLTIGLLIQPETIRSLPPSFSDRGLMQRFLYSLPVSRVGFRQSTPEPIDETVRATYINNMKRLLEFKPDNPIHLTLSVDASEAEVQNRDEIEIMLQDDGELGGMKEWGSKLAGNIIRFAGLLHFSENINHLPNIPTVISKEIFESAKRMRGYFIEHAKEAYGIMESTDDDKEEKYIAKRIAERYEGKARFDHQNLWQLMKKKYKKVDLLNEILIKLEARNYILRTMEGKKSIILINPLLSNTTKSTPIGPNIEQTYTGQALGLGEGEILEAPIYPNDASNRLNDNPARGETGVLGATRVEGNPNTNIGNSREEQQLGAIGAVVCQH